MADRWSFAGAKYGWSPRLKQKKRTILHMTPCKGRKLPNLTLHCTIHAIVENQVAMGDEAPTRMLERLQREGLDRHEALHALGSVLAGRVFELMTSGGQAGDANTHYWKALEKLTAEDRKHST